MLYLFHRASSFVPQVSTCLATQDSPNVLSTAFPGYRYQLCCYVKPCEILILLLGLWIRLREH